MKDLVHIIAGFAVALFLIAASGCAAVGDRIDAGQAVVDVITLDQDFEAARDALLSNDFTAEERLAINGHLEALQIVRNSLEDISKVASTALDPVTADAFLERIAKEFNGIRAIYTGYIQRTGTVPDPRLRRYAGSAVRLWGQMKLAVEAGQATQARHLQGLVVYVARGYLLFRSGGAVPMTYQEILDGQDEEGHDRQGEGGVS